MRPSQRRSIHTTLPPSSCIPATMMGNDVFHLELYVGWVYCKLDVSKALDATPCMLDPLYTHHPAPECKHSDSNHDAHMLYVGDLLLQTLLPPHLTSPASDPPLLQKDVTASLMRQLGATAVGSSGDSGEAAGALSLEQYCAIKEGGSGSSAVTSRIK
jgi:hypothetical protein